MALPFLMLRRMRKKSRAKAEAESRAKEAEAEAKAARAAAAKAEAEAAALRATRADPKSHAPVVVQSVNGLPSTTVQGVLSTTPAVMLVSQAQASEVPRVPLVVMCTMSVVIPEGVYPGGRFNITVGGQNVQVTVPENTKPGDVLQISI
uniref:Uncharacterized protein n=1 Tax=Lotharella globosa TaxID=91324 RepID=A0A7S3YBF5_9EUKA|mmetsp:Transcript_37881/g.72849  ORF Transcript_37881/g.72849 Transcript_37881/m.72849 type:complete len:149 (-) Transcript_37881:239-685(-)